MALWSSISAEKLSFRTWNGEDVSVVYNGISGDTHLVEELALHLLQLVGVSPLSTETLALQLTDFFVENDPNKIQEFIDSTLLQLETVGLVYSIAR